MLSTLTYGRRLLVMSIIFVLALSALGLMLNLNPSWIHSKGRDDLMWMSFLQDIVGFIIPSLLCAFIFSRRPFEYLSLGKGADMKVLGGIFLILTAAAPALNQLTEWNNSILFPEALKGIEQQMRAMENDAAAQTKILLSSTSFGGLLAEIAVVGLLVPFSEELFFRGTLQRTLASGKGVSPHLAIWVTAFIFSAVHFQFFGFFTRLMLGVFFGYLVWWTGSLWSSVFCHALNNSIVVINTWRSLRGADSLPQDVEKFVGGNALVVTAVSVAVTAVLLILFRKRVFIRNRTKR